MDGLVLPEYPYARLNELKAEASLYKGGLVDLSIGTPCDSAPSFIGDHLAKLELIRGYPPSLGTAEFLNSARGWFARTFGVELGDNELAACVGTKEMVASLPHFLRLRNPEKDTVLFPGLSYPTYEMGAIFAGCRPVRVNATADHRMDFESISREDIERALLIWINSPGNPVGQLEKLDEAYEWASTNNVVVASDECYSPFTYSKSPASILQFGRTNALAVHSLSKRSNLAGARVGFYCGDSDLVSYLSLLRMHSGLMVAGPIQKAASLAYEDESHVNIQRDRYRDRLANLVESFGKLGCQANLPDGGLYVWAEIPSEFPNSWAFVARLAREFGVLVSPGDLYGPLGARYVRVAAVQPDEVIESISGRIESWA